MTRQDLVSLFHEVIERELPCLRALTDERAAKLPASGGTWTCKQELGHLLDSAANNHLRFVLAALGPGDFHGQPYAQDAWVAIHGYQEAPWDELVDLWELYNRALARVVERIPADRLGVFCHIGSEEPVTLGFVIEDYVFHLQHHLDHLLSRERITPYPQVNPQPSR